MDFQVEKRGVKNGSEEEPFVSTEGKGNYQYSEWAKNEIAETAQRLRRLGRSHEEICRAIKELIMERTSDLDVEIALDGENTLTALLSRFEERRIEKVREAYQGELVKPGSPIWALDISRQVGNALERVGIMTIDQLLSNSMARLYDIRGLGETRVKSIIRALAKTGLRLRKKIPEGARFGFTPKELPPEGLEDAKNKRLAALQQRIEELEEENESLKEAISSLKEEASKKETLLDQYERHPFVPLLRVLVAGLFSPITEKANEEMDLERALASQIIKAFSQQAGEVTAEQKKTNELLTELIHG